MLRRNVVWAGLVRWWAGERFPFNQDRWELSFDPESEALRISLRRSWVISSFIGVLFIVFGGLVAADRYWPIFFLLFSFAFIIVPLAEEPATFAWYAGVLGVLAVFNLTAQLQPLGIVLRLFWLFIVGWQLYGVYQFRDLYYRFRHLYGVYPTSGMGISYVLRHAWVGSLVLALLTVGLLGLGVASPSLPKPILNVAGLFAHYTSIVSPGLALAALGNPDAPRLAVKVTLVLVTLIAAVIILFAV